MIKKEQDEQIVDNQETTTSKTDTSQISGENNGNQCCDNLTDESFEDGDVADKMSEEVREWQDKYIRLQAEFDNYRKRTLKEKMDLVESAGADVIKSILPAVDDFDRARTAMESSTDHEAMKQGVELIYHKLIETLKHNGVTEIEAMGSPLDTDYHDAIAKVPAPTEENKGKVIDVVQKGYKLKDKVIRFAKVVIGE